ncbi:MAG TPA: DUF4271 domain-containing protein [Bacteroidales bacterium]|jgi:hypothetical protein|nr:DUF4271 domain-containing protein [Bacteroidales bacterium]
MSDFPSPGQQENLRVSHNEISSGTTAVRDVKPVFDTSAVCRRKSIHDFTFHDPGNFVRALDYPVTDRTVIDLAGKARILNREKNEILISRLREGEPLPVKQRNEDWVIFIILAAALLLTLIRSSKKPLQNIQSFFLFRGVADSGSHNPAELFQLSGTIKNLASFIIISLFIYTSASWFGLIPAGMAKIVFWLICLAVVIAAITLRHIICLVTGNLSGTSEAFGEYLTGVYLSYHFSAVILAILTVMISYTKIVTPNFIITCGITAFGIMYLFRVMRLFVIFINRNISILYLILYLCALEILPVAIAIRFFSGSV